MLSNGVNIEAKTSKLPDMAKLANISGHALNQKASRPTSRF
jgi:hypothetical protein